MCNNPEATIIGTVADFINRKHTKVGSARYKYLVHWDSGGAEWLTAGEIKLAEEQS